MVAGLIGGAVAIPIERLTRAAEAVAAGERQAALPEPRGREVRLLTRALEWIGASSRSGTRSRRSSPIPLARAGDPIASVRASGEVLLEGAADDPATARKFAARILESALVLQALTSDLLSLARLEARGLEGERASLELRALVQEARQAQSAQAEQAGVELIVSGVHEAWGRGEVRWLRRAVENLISNAIQHAPRGSAVRIELGEVAAGWSIAVSDQARRRSLIPRSPLLPLCHHPPWLRRQRARPRHRPRHRRAARRPRPAARERPHRLDLRALAPARLSAPPGSASRERARSGFSARASCASCAAAADPPA